MHELLSQAGCQPVLDDDQPRILGIIIYPPASKSNQGDRGLSTAPFNVHKKEFVRTWRLEAGE